MKNQKPTLTHTEIYSYAINYVKDKYDEDEKNAALAEAKDADDLAKMIRTQSQWKDKLTALCRLYEMETGVPHDFMSE